MISKIKGKIRKKKESSLIIELIDGLFYEVSIPKAVMKVIDREKDLGDEVTLDIYHYYQSDPSKSIPVLIGFMNEIEREFFERFITVSGIGPKAACKALALPFSEIADAIDRQDIALLKTLPGVGEQRAREIVAKLQGKVGKFGLIQDRFISKVPEVSEDIKEEAMSVLLQLQYKKKEAVEMVSRALKRNPNPKSSEELLNEIYNIKKHDKEG